MRRVVLIASVFLFLISAKGVEAQPQAVASSAQEAAAQARRARDIGRLNDAIEGYARAYQLSGEASLLFSLAEVHREAGHDADALRIFQNYVRRGAEGPNRDSAEKQIKELERQVRRAESVKPAGADVGPARPQKITADKKSAAGAGPSAAPATAAVPFVVPPRPAPAPVVVAPPPPAPAPSPAPPPIGAAPIPVAQPATQSASGASAAGVDLTAQAAPHSEPASPPLPRWVPWALSAATIGLGTAAIVSGLSASNRYDELRNSCGQTTEGCASSDIEAVKSRAHRANLLWLLTGVAAVGSGITIYVNTEAAGASGLWNF